MSTETESKGTLLKQQLAARIVKHIRESKLTQRAAAKELGLPKSKIAQIAKGDVHGISIDKLFGVLAQLDDAVEVTLGQGASQEVIRYETDRERHALS